MTLKKILIPAIAMSLAAGFASAAPFAADGYVNVQSIVVQYDPATIHTADGARALYRRIRNAAFEVCGDTSVSLVGPDKWIQHRCATEAMNTAIKQLDAPELKLLHARLPAKVASN